MSDDEFEDEPELDEELDEEELVADFVEDDDDLLVDDDLVEVVVVDEEIDVVADPVVAVVEELVGAEPETEDDDDIVDLEEELHPDDVEEALDVVLRERTAKVGLEDEEDEELEHDDRGEAGTRIVPRRPGEFLCSSCFLVLPRHQLADEKRMLCRDCV